MYALGSIQKIGKSTRLHGGTIAWLFTCLLLLAQGVVTGHGSHSHLTLAGGQVVADGVSIDQPASNTLHPDDEVPQLTHGTGCELCSHSNSLAATFPIHSLFLTFTEASPYRFSLSEVHVASAHFPIASPRAPPAC